MTPTTTPGPTVTIDHGNLRHNVDVLAKLVAPAQVMLAVKTNAYGHGLVEVSETALRCGASSLALLEVDAGVTLRQSGVTEPLFAWLLGDADDYRHAAEYDIDLGISSLSELEAAAGAGSTRAPVTVHLKIDTGLTRNGASEELWPQLCARAAVLAASGIIRVRGIWSHLADASPEDDADARARFLQAVDIARAAGLTPEILHLGASSAGLRFPEGRFDAVRFGIAAYGISPFGETPARELNLRPVMTVTAPVTSVANDIVTVSAGFAHGIPTGSHPDRHVVIDGRQCDVIDVSVDSMRVRTRVSGNETAPPPPLGAIAIIFGIGGPSAEELGAWCDTIGDEIVTGISSRLPRIHVY